MNAKKELQKWLDENENYKTPDLDALPNLDLYMDQVITYIDQQLMPLSCGEKLITSSMVNNYVKGNVIPNPVAKKYSKKHLAYILSICLLKNVLPISDVSNIINSKPYDEMYKIFKQNQDSALSSSISKVKKSLTNVKKETEDEELKLLALQLATEANSAKLISEKILSIIEEKKKEEIEKIKKKTVLEEKKSGSSKKKSNENNITQNGA